MARRKAAGGTPARFGEAAAGSFQARTAAILRALRASSPDAPYPHVVALFQDPDHVVVERDGRLTRYDYSLSADGAASLAGPVLVEETFRTVETAAEAAADAGSLIEAAGPRPGRWKVRAIRSGLSANGNFYPAAALREAVERFSGARVLARSDEDHVAGRDTSVGALIGRLVEPRFAEAAEGGEILATMELIEPEGSIAVKLREAHGRGMSDLMGLSIVASGRHRVARLPGGRTVRLVEAIKRVDSVDLIVHPSAGGALLELIEAARGAGGTVDDGEDAMRERMKRLIEARLGKARLTEAVPGNDEALEALYREAVAGDAGTADAGSAPGESGPGAGSGDTPAGLSAADVDARIADASRLAEARASARAAVAAASLAEAAPDDLGTEAVTAAIEAERAYLASAAPGGQVTGLGGPARITESRDGKVRKMWDALLDPTDTSCVSLREAYAETTGDRRVTGQVRDCDAASLREAVGSGTLAEILGDSIARRMIADYRETGIHDAWARFCHATTVTDFRTQRRLRWGGYGDLPEVAERAPYEQLATPGDAEESYAASKRGGTESVTLEAIRNDDLAQLQRLPAKLGRAAKRTLSAFAASFLTANAALADGKALFHADHGNLGSTALGKASLAAARLAMVKQAEPGSGKALGIGPRVLIVPFALEETAVDLFRRTTENDRTFVQSLALDIVALPELADDSDWYLAADPLDIPTIEIGFLDGRREPELFVQDSPTQGSLFTHDQITWKVRHVYGGTVLDHRGLYKAAVT